MRLILVAILIMAFSSSQELIQSTPVVFSCPVTSPGDDRPPASVDPFDDDDLLIHEDGLWVTVPRNGVLRLQPDDAITFGDLEEWRSTTVTWLRDEGVEGWVIVSGERLDEESEDSPQTPLSPQRQYVRIGAVKTGLAFPSEGCWEVTGTVGGRTITFVMDVRFMGDDIPEECEYCRPPG